MTTQDKVEAFKNELRNYRYYKNKLKELDEQIELNFYDKTGVKGISYDKIPSHPSEEAIAQFRLSLIEKSDELALERERIVKQVNYIRNTLDKFDKPVRTCLILIYVKKYSYEKVGKRVNWSTGGLYAYLEREISKNI